MKHRHVCGFLVISAVFTAPSALAASDSGVDVGLRLGYGLPLGTAGYSANDPTRASALSDIYTGQVPVWIDLGYRFTPNVMAGLYFQYGFAFVKDCQSGASCSAHDIRLGAQFQYRILPGETANPWVGFGAGYEWSGATISAGGLDATVSVEGFEFANFQGGVDFTAADGFGIGPFVSFSLGEYATASLDVPGVGSISGRDIPNKGIHEWLVLGVRGVFDP